MVKIRGNSHSEEGNHQIVKKINGNYWLYFGDTKLFMASSDNLIEWTPLEDAEKGTLISVLHPRRGYFDSRLVEPGPYALYDENKGILLMYNASNAANYNDVELPKFTYAAGQALFNPQFPYKLEKEPNRTLFILIKTMKKLGRSMRYVL